VRVRRARVGAELEVLDGRGHAVHATLARIDARSAALVLGDPVALPTASPLELWLALTDPDAVTTAIASACELGVTHLVLVRCAHSHQAEPSTARIDRVVRAAMRQCGRPAAPEIVPTRALVELVADSEPGGVIAWERLRGSAGAAAPHVRARLLVGPAGGLRDDEVDACVAHGMTPLSLGPWTLRSETAVVAGLACLRARAG
jgi:16S rRNA (uracil1498-N3)-methyltransferase